MKNRKQKLSSNQIEVVVSCSGELGGLTAAETAEKLSISVQAVNERLRTAEQICPQVFPLITKQEADVLALLDIGWSNNDISEELDLPDYTVSKAIKALQDKGRGVADSSPVTMQRYAPHLDSQIKEKF